MTKSSPQQIRERFDALVDAFSDADRGQRTAIDSALCLDLIADIAATAAPDARAVLDLGCGAGNYSIRLLRRFPDADVTLVDLSRAMLDRAVARVSPLTRGRVEAVEGDVRDVPLGESRFDVAVAAAVLHHLRTDAEWDAVFARMWHALRPGGMLFVYDLVEHEGAAVRDVMWQRYGAFLEALGGAEYRNKVFAYIDEEDTPRPVTQQMDQMKRAGFVDVDLLHKHGCFAAYVGCKPRL